MYIHILLNRLLVTMLNSLHFRASNFYLFEKKVRNLLILFTVLLAGCSNLAPFSDIFKKSTPPESLTSSQKAESLKNAGNYLESANEYLRLARSVSPSERPRYQLAAIQSLFKADMINEAKAELIKVNISQNLGLEPYFQLVQTQLSLLEGQTDRAFLRLQKIDFKTLSLDLQKYYHELRIQILEYKGDFLNAVIKRVQLHNSLNVQEKSDNQESLWKSLMRMNEQELQNAFQNNRDDLSGWIALALLYKTTKSRDFQQVVSKWQARYPTHPALQGLIQNLFRDASNLSSKPSNVGNNKKIALLLPFSSRRQGYAEAIYRGFMAANYASGDAATVKIYDENPDIVAQAYQRALSEGADFIVGPLQKESIDALLSSQISLEVPILSLNHSENAPLRQNFYQFSLSPEDEAHSVAMKMWEDGYRATVVLVPKGLLGERVLNAFQSLWTQRGGRLVMAEFYEKQKVEPSAQKVLQYQAMFDSVFMIASPEDGREFQRFLKYNTQNIPVYSMSHIYSGKNVQNEDVELEGVIFGDMSWRIAPSQKAQQLQSNFQMTWPESIPEFSREYAFGIDAYHLLSRVAHPSNARFSFQWDGQTGRLTMDRNGIIHRQWMHWAKFVNGRPQLLNPNAPNPDDSTIPDSMRQESLIRELNELPIQ